MDRKRRLAGTAFGHGWRPRPVGLAGPWQEPLELMRFGAPRDPALGQPLLIGDDKAHARVQLALVPLQLGQNPPRRKRRLAGGQRVAGHAEDRLAHAPQRHFRLR